MQTQTEFKWETVEEVVAYVKERAAKGLAALQVERAAAKGEERRRQMKAAFCRSFSSAPVTPEEFAELMGPIHHREEGEFIDLSGVRREILTDSNVILECRRRRLTTRIITNPDRWTDTLHWMELLDEKMADDRLSDEKYANQLEGRG